MSFTPQRYDFRTSAPDYARLAQELPALLAGEHDLVANAANTAALLFDALPRGQLGGLLLPQGRGTGGRPVPGQAGVRAHRARARRVRHGGRRAAHADGARRARISRAHRLRCRLALGDRRAAAARRDAARACSTSTARCRRASMQQTPRAGGPRAPLFSPARDRGTDERARLSPPRPGGRGRCVHDLGHVPDLPARAARRCRRCRSSPTASPGRACSSSRLMLLRGELGELRQIFTRSRRCSGAPGAHRAAHHRQLAGVRVGRRPTATSSTPASATTSIRW